jgi:penicillin-binding protein 2
VRDRSQARLTVVAVFVMSLVVTLGARAFALQVTDAPAARAAALDNRQRELILPAARGMILDQRGRPLATNRLALDVTVARRTLARQADDGDAVLHRLGALLGVSPRTLAARLKNCGTPGASPQPDCWNGAAGADPTVVEDIRAEDAARLLADPAAFAGVSVESRPVRQYPGDRLAAHALGHVGRVSAEDLAADPQLAGVAGTGRAGLEAQYDDALRGRPGLERIAVDSAGHRESAGTVTPAEAGQTLVTHLDVGLQAVVEQQLAAAIARGRGRVDPNTGTHYAADGGAAVVLDVRTGAVLAIASAPSFDANVWTGGISSADYGRLTDPAAGQPLLDRSLQAALAPASTFKVVSSAAAMGAGYSGAQLLDCPSSYRVGGRAFRNYESRAHGPITLARSLEVSCDTVYYEIAHRLWQADGGTEPRPGAADAIASAAADFGFGARTGIDLPGESAGNVASRAAKQRQWQQLHTAWCARAEQGYPEMADRERAAYLRGLARENCTDGMLWRVGDALNAAVGQGDTAATVLQIARAYAAVGNGGTLYRPQVARALLRADGQVVERFAPTVTGRLDVPAADLAYLRDALRGVVERGTARKPFAGFPLGAVPIAAKTGTAEVYGKQSTAWLASFAPATAPRFAVVMMVSQGGTGAGTTGRAVRAIYERLFGVKGGSADSRRSVLLGGDVAAGLPDPGAAPASSRDPSGVLGGDPSPSAPSAVAGRVGGSGESVGNAVGRGPDAVERQVGDPSRSRSLAGAPGPRGRPGQDEAVVIPTSSGRGP